MGETVGLLGSDGLFFYEVYFFEKGDAWEAVEVCEGESTQS